MAEIATVCPYCGCGCGLYLQVSEGRVIGTAPSRAHPVGQGRLCIKGWHSHELVDNPNRLTTPLVRRAEKLVEASWDEALGTAAQGLRSVLDSRGPQAVGVLGSARCTNEDNYVLVRFARGTLGTSNIDCSLSRQYFVPISQNGAPAAGWASTGPLSDLEESDLIVLVNTDPTEEHPAAAAHVYRARERGAKVVTISSRRHPLARLADAHLPVRPGAEARAIASILSVLLTEEPGAGEGGGELDALRSSVADLKPEALETETGVPAEAVRQAAQLWGAAERVTVGCGAGMALAPQALSGVQVVSALAAAAAATGGPRVTLLNLLPRSNMQGCRDMGVMPDLLPGYTQLTDDEGVRRFESAWNCTLRREAGLKAWQMLDQVGAMYVMGDDPLANAADPKSAREALGKLECLVVQDLFMSQTAALAHVVLPAAAFAERAGSWTNLERRVQRISPAADPPGDAREDWRIIAGISSAMGESLLHEDARAVSAEIEQVLPIYAGLSLAQLPLNSGAVWPASDGAGEVGAALARPSEVAVAAADPSEKTSEEYPLLLAADPTLRPWDGEATVCNTLAAAVEFSVAEKDYPGGMLLLNPEDAEKAGLRSGQTARVASAVGESQMRVRVTDEVAAGVALLPYRQAAESGVLQASVDSDTGRAVLLPTAFSVGPPK